MDPSTGTSLFDQVFCLCPQPAAFIDRKGVFTQVNPAWKTKTGHDPSELIGHGFDELVPAEDREALRAGFERLQGPRETFHYKTGFSHRDGSLLRFEWQCLSPDDDGPIFATLFDLTDLMKTEEALLESRENYRLLADCVSEGVVLSEDGIILEANAAFGRMAWMDPSEVLGKNIAVLVPPDHRKRLLDEQLEGADEGYELTGIRKNGDIFPLEVRTRFVEFRGRRIRVNLLRDISDRKKLLELTRKENERALQEQKKVFAALTQNTQEPFALLDGDGRWIHGAFGQALFLGYETSELVDRAFFDLAHPEDRPRQIQKFAELVRRPGAVETLFFRARRKDGAWRHLEVSAQNLLQDSSLRGVVVNVRDISERIQAQDRLMESERFHRALSENSLDVVLIHEAGGMVRYASPSLRTVLGEEPSEWMGKNLLSWVHPDDLPLLAEAFGKVLSGEGAQAALELRFKHRNGSWRSMDLVARNLLQEPVVEGIVVNLRDVTERRKAEAAFHLSEARLRGVFDSSNQAFELIDLEGRLTALNELAKTLHRQVLGGDLRVGGFLLEAVPETFRERARAFLEDAKRGPLKFHDLPALDAASQEHWFDLNAYPVKDASGKLVGVCVAFTQEDERKAAEERLLQVERLAAIGQVTGAIAHGMRNPLSVITALAREKAEEGDEDAKRMALQAERLLRLMEDILDFSRRTELKRESLSAAKILQSAIASARRQAGKAADGVTLRWEGTPDDRFEGDRVRLEQVFHNLVLNAFEALAGSGQVTLACRREPGRMVVTVEDDGPGPADQDLERVFEPFFSTKKFGTGLGLAVSRKIVEDHGGTLEASRREPRGMRMTVALPLPVAPASPGNAAPAVGGAGGFRL